MFNNIQLMYYRYARTSIQIMIDSSGFDYKQIV